MQRLNRVRWLSLVAGILLIALSIINMLNPVEFTVSLVTFFAASLIVLGVIRIIRYFSWTVFSTGSFLIGGILDVLLGVLMLKNKLASVQVLLILVGFWVLTNAIYQIAISIDFKKVGIKNWWIDLLTGIIGVIMGIMLLGDFGLSTYFTAVLISVYTLMFGIAFISTFFGITKFMKYTKY